MADQASADPRDANFDWREREAQRQAERDAQDKASREDPAYGDFIERLWNRLGSRAAGVLYSVSKELKKQPLLRETIASTAAELDTVFPIVAEWPDVKVRLAAGSSVDREADRLLGTMREVKLGGAAVIAEIVAGRERLERLWERVEDADKAVSENKDDESLKAKAEELFSAWQEATIQLDHCLFLAVMQGKVDGTEAIRALKGDATINLNATEYPLLSVDAEQDGPSLGVPAETTRLTDEQRTLEHDILEGIGSYTAVQVDNLPKGSRWRVPLLHLSDRLRAPQGGKV